MNELRRCRQCGYEIILGYRNAAAQERGFCGTGCEDVYEGIKDQLKHEAEKDLAREADL